MTAPIAVLGGTGVYARHLVPRLVAGGHAVRAIVRRPEAAGVARACGADVQVADVFDEDALVAALVGCAVGVNLATSLPGPSGRGDFEANDRLREHGTPIWLRACRRAGVTRIVQQSVAMVNAGAGDAWSDEDTAYASASDDVAGRAIHAALAMEDAVRASGLDWLVLRGALFYGPGTGFDDDWFARARAGKLRAPGDGSGDRALAGGAHPHRRGRPTRALARAGRVHRRRRGRRRARHRRPARLPVVPRAKRPRPRGARVVPELPRSSRRPRALTAPVSVSP